MADILVPEKALKEFYLFSGLCVLDLLNNSSNYKTNIICDELYCNCRAYCETERLKTRNSCQSQTHASVSFLQPISVYKG